MANHFFAAEHEKGYAESRRLIEASSRLSRTARLPDVVTIPVVVHLVAHRDQPRVTDAQVQAQLRTLNADFRGVNADRANLPEVFRGLADDAGIEFRLARRDPLGRPTTGINRVETSVLQYPRRELRPDEDSGAAIDAELKVAGTGAVAWPRGDYLNIWVCNMGRNPLGYAAFPGSAAWRDGVVIDHSCFGSGGTARPKFDLGRTATHEVGHWLDLLHIWGDDAGACSRSDNVSDTPNQGGSNGGTPAFPKISCGNAPNGDLFMNFMDYVDDIAMFMFTAGQIDRMHAALQGPRRSLLSSRGLQTPEQAADVRESRAAAIFLENVGEEAGAAPEYVFDGVTWVSPQDLAVGI